MHKTITTITAVVLFVAASYAGNSMRYYTQPCDTIENVLLSDKEITDNDIMTEEEEDVADTVPADHTTVNPAAGVN